MTEYSETAVALAGLVRVCEPPSASLALFVGKVGPVAAWRGVLDRRAPRPVLSATAARTQNLTQEVLIDRAGRISDCDCRGCQADRPGPSGLAGAGRAIVRGRACSRGARRRSAGGVVRPRPELGELPEQGVTIVGSRASSAYGQRVASEISHELAFAG